MLRERKQKMWAVIGNQGGVHAIHNAKWQAKDYKHLGWSIIPIEVIIKADKAFIEIERDKKVWLKEGYKMGYLKKGDVVN